MSKRRIVTPAAISRTSDNVERASTFETVFIWKNNKKSLGKYVRSTLFHPIAPTSQRDDDRDCVGKQFCLVYSYVAGVHGRGVLGTGAVVKVWSDVDDGAALVVVIVVIPHHQTTDPIPRSHHSGAAEPHLLRVIVELHGWEHRAQVQLRDVVEHRQRQHQECQADQKVAWNKTFFI